MPEYKSRYRSCGIVIKEGGGCFDAKGGSGVGGVTAWAVLRDSVRVAGVFSGRKKARSVAG